MSSKPFLITGATGSTGRNVVEFLLERGHKVRAFVHKHNEQSSQLQQLGAEIAVGDLLDFMTIRPALDGISGAYFVYPIVPGIVEATAYVAVAQDHAAGLFSGTDGVIEKITRLKPMRLEEFIRKHRSAFE